MKPENQINNVSFGFFKRNFDKIPLLIATILIMVVLTLLTPYFLTGDNLGKVARQISINTIITVGMALVIITGGIDLSVGSTVALTNCVIATCMAVYGLAPHFERTDGRGCSHVCRLLQRTVDRKGQDTAFYCHIEYDDHHTRRRVRLHERLSCVRLA